MSGRTTVQVTLATVMAAFGLALLAAWVWNGAPPALAGAGAVGQNINGQADIGAMESSAMSVVVGQGAFAGVDVVADGAVKYVNVVGTAQVTATLWLTTTTTGPVTVTVSGSVPVTVTAPISVTVTNGVLYVADTAEVGGEVVIDEDLQVNGPGTFSQEIAESADLSGRVLVYNPTGSSQTALVSGSGSTPGEGALSAVESRIGLIEYLPVVYKSPVPEGYFDDFSSYSEGIWPDGSAGNCDVSYRNGHYRVKVKDGWSGSAYKCVVITRSPCFQEIGTIGIDARRTSNEDYELWYGMYFSAGSDYTEDRWAVEVRPDKVPCDGSDRPYFWLNCIEDGDACFSNKYKCTNNIDTEQDEWNAVDVTRDGDEVTVFINEDEELSKTSDALEDAGYFNLFAYSEDHDHDIIVEFDDFYAVPQVLDID